MSTFAQPDAVVVGGGPAGASVACLLARQGRPVVLLERDAEPRHKICGEFISVEARRDLARLGIRVEALGGSPIGKLRLMSGRAMVETALPFEGIGLTRRALDEALLREAEASGASVRRGAAVRSIVPEGAALSIRLRGDQPLEARAVFLATGKHDLAGLKRPIGSSGSDLVGFKMYFKLQPSERRELEGWIEIVLFDGGYAGLQCVEGGMVNLCLLVKRSAFDATGRSWSGLLERLQQATPHLRQRLRGAETLLSKPLTIANVPYGFVHRPIAAEPMGLFRLGDQMGVIPSFCGDGIAIALHTARLAASVYAEHGPAASTYHARARGDVQGPIRLASGLYALSQAPLGRRVLVAACGLYPGVLASVAAKTRVPDWERREHLRAAASL